MSLSISSLTDDQLHKQINELCRGERELTLAFIDHLIEVERRRLYAKRGFSSMFAYCIESLGYSGLAASRRIAAARSIRRFPKIRRMLAARELTLSTLAVVARDLTPQNTVTILKSICGKSARDAEKVLAGLRGVVPVREHIRPVVTLKTIPPMPWANPTNHNRVGCRTPQLTANTPPTKSESNAAPAAPTEQRFRFEFAGSEAFMRKYQRAAALLSNKLKGKITIEGVFEALLDEYIERHDPAARSKRREQRAKNAPPTVQSSVVTRHIPRAVRDQVHQRDQHRCTYVSPDGHRCNETYNLHVDHIEPFAAGGGHDPGNLRLLCAAHNRLMAERVFGKALLARFTKRE